MLKTIKKIILDILYWFSGFIPKSNIIVFGAWMGDRFSDNPKAVFEYLISEDSYNYKCYWIANKEVINYFKNKSTNYNEYFVKRNSMSALYLMARSKYSFFSHSFRDISSINLSRKSIQVQLWHGFPIKKIGDDVSNNVANTYKYHEQYQVFLSSSIVNEQRIMSAFKNFGIENSTIINVGQPRNDIFTNVNKNKKNRQKFKESFSLSDNDIIVLYLPTFRDNCNLSFSFMDVQENLLKKLEDNDIYIFEKQHYAGKKNKNKNKFSIICLEEEYDTQFLLSISDILITDYSSVYMDFIIQNRPVIHFIHDGDNYERNDRGLYNDFEKEVAGPVIYTADELVLFLINNKLNDFGIEQRNKANLIGNQYNRDSNTKYIVEKILLKEKKL